MSVIPSNAFGLSCKESSFVIHGEPGSTAQQKGAFARGKRVMFYTKDKVKAEENRLMIGFYANRPVLPLQGAIYLELAFVFPFTLAEAKKYAAELSDESFTVPRITRPDVDNCAKLPIDVMTKAGFFNDDSQIVCLTLYKFSGCVPQIKVTIRQYVHAGLVP